MNVFDFFSGMGNLNSGILASILLAQGIIGLLFGYNLVRLYVYLIGFVIGFLILSIMGTTSSSSWAPLMLGIVGGSILGLICYLLWYLGIFALGALLGVILSVVLGCQEPFIIGVVAIIFGVMVIAIRKFMIIVSTSCVGAYTIICAVTHMIGSWNWGGVILAQILLATFGIWFQYSHAKTNPKQIKPNNGNTNASTTATTRSDQAETPPSA